MEQFVWKKGSKPGDYLKKVTREYNADRVLSHRRNESRYGHFNHQLPSTEKQREVVSLAVSVFAEHFRRLGVSLDREIGFEFSQFHFFDRDGFDEEFPDMKGALGNHGRHGIIAAVESESQGEFFLTLLHEMTHDVSVKKYELDEEEKFPMYRNGYKMVDRSDSLSGIGGERAHLEAFNEGVVEMTALRMMARYADQFQNFGIAEKDMEDTLQNFSYEGIVAVINEIISGLAVVLGEDDLETWKRIERGQYTGEMMWMRGIDLVFGKGSLRVLDSLIAWPKTDAERDHNKKVLRYFQMKDADERAAFQSELY